MRRSAIALALVSGGLAGLGSGARAEPSLTRRAAVWPAPGGPRLAWRVTEALDPVRMSARERVVDATTGALLAERERVRRAAGHLASIYRDNPIATPTRATIALARLPADADALADPGLVALSCVDPGACDGATRACAFEARAQPGPGGDFLAIEPPADPLDPSDAFAELSAYAHLARALDFFAAIAPEVVVPPLTVIGNHRLAVACGDALAPLDDAFYLPADVGLPGLDGPVVALGQGAAVDVALDGDLAAHEAGHALIDAAAPDLGFARIDRYGVDVTAGGLVEGLPDYLAAALTGEPRLAEYVGDALVPGATALRDLEEIRRCPDDLGGEPHADGLIVAGALWTARAALAADLRPAFDAAVVRAAATLGADATFAGFAAALADESDAADAALRARGVGGEACALRVRTLGPGEAHARLVLADKVGALAPAPVQFRVDGRGATLRITASLTRGAASGLAVLVKSELPIHWSDGAPDDATRLVRFAARPGDRVEASLERPPGWPIFVQLVSSTGGHAVADLEIAVPPADGDDEACEDDPALHETGCGASGGGGGLAAALLTLLTAGGTRSRRSDRRSRSGRSRPR